MAPVNEVLYVSVGINMRSKDRLRKEYAYKNFEKFGSSYFHVHVRANNHFPQYLKYHTLVFFIYAAL
jgi:hypothetical protein